MADKKINQKIPARWADWLRPLVFAAIAGTALIGAAMGLTGTYHRFTPKTYPLEWVKIPAGQFLMGSPEGAPSANLDETPRHWIFLPAYQISRFLITNQQYAECALAGICDQPSSRINDAELANFPVVNISWEDAQIFCRWHGGRLPTEAEWEKAARGGLEGALYPWGDEIDCSLANYGDCVGGPSPVDSHTPNPYGLFDMAGNVCEWTADWYGGDYYRNSPARNPRGPAEGEYRVLRGGCWGGDKNSMRAAYRLFNLPDYPHDFIGFRCAYSPVPWRR